MTTKKTSKTIKEVVEKKEANPVKRFCFRFTSNVSIGGKIFQKDSLINLSEEELVVYRPYVICHDETTQTKKPCKRC